jgi:hypothetical protein
MNNNLSLDSLGSSFDNLRREWRERDQKLDAAIQLNNQLLRQSLLDKNQVEIKKIGFASAFERISWIPCIILFGIFNAQHFLDWKFFIPGVLLQAWVTIMPILSLRQRAALQSVDFGQPVVTLQREISTLKMHRLLTFKWAFLIGQIIWWVPFVIVFFKGVLGINLYAQSEWLNHFFAWNIAVGVLLIPILIWLAKHISPRLQNANWFQKLIDEIAGRDMQTAKEFLRKLESFESEKP